jgi:hypothetical protein
MIPFLDIINSNAQQEKGCCLFPTTKRWGTLEYHTAFDANLWHGIHSEADRLSSQSNKMMGQKEGRDRTGRSKSPPKRGTSWSIASCVVVVVRVLTKSKWRLFHMRGNADVTLSFCFLFLREDLEDDTNQNSKKTKKHKSIHLFLFEVLWSITFLPLLCTMSISLCRLLHR